MRNPIVIIGGMGPQASLRFHELLIRKSEAYHAGGNNDYPCVAHFSLPVDDFISNENSRQDAVATLKNLSPTIRSLQPQQITLACNTAHLLMEDVVLLQHEPFVSIIRTTVQAIKKDGKTCIGILGSSTTLRTKLYDRELHKNNISVTLPNQAQRVELDRIIRAIIANTAGRVEMTRLLHIAKSLISKGAEGIILGCTELPLLFPKEQLNEMVYDTLDVYAQAVIDTYYSV